MRSFLAPLAAALLLAGSATASAATLNDGSDVVSLSASTFTADATTGHADITVQRSDASGKEIVRYGITSGTTTVGYTTATPNVDYEPTKGTLEIPDGQASATFSIPIHADPAGSAPVTADVYIYGVFPGQTGDPHDATLRIVSPGSADVRDPLNPLGLTPAPPAGNPLVGARWFVDGHQGLAARAARHLRHSQPHTAALLDVIAGQPETARFGPWDDPSGNNPTAKVTRYFKRVRAEAPGTVPFIASYRLKHVSCGGYADSPGQQRNFKLWYDRFAKGISANRAVLFLELDSLITVGCLSHQGVAIRVQELNYAINTLASLPHLVIYLDAGAADAAPAAQMANLLKAAGVDKIQGFFLNWSHFDWTSREVAYGEQISRRLGGTHFVVSTAVNGRGPLVPRSRIASGNEVLCNPGGRGLGPAPTTDTGHTNVDAFAWIGNPGKSGGNGPRCMPHSPPTGTFWVDYAVMLVKHASLSARSAR
jgi:endoglucanase